MTQDERATIQPGRRGIGDRGRVGGFLVLLVGGLLLIVVGAGWRSTHVMLFDGIMVAEPYRYLDPPPGERGHPTRYVQTKTVAGHRGPLIAYTRESPPQAQMYALRRAVRLPAGAKEQRVRIVPIEPPVLPTGGQIVGNVYSMTVTDEDGVMATVPDRRTVSVAIRSPDGTDESAVIAVLEDGVWQPLPTESGGLPDLWLADVTAFGTFAIIVPDAPIDGAAASPFSFGSAPASQASASAAPASPTDSMSLPPPSVRSSPPAASATTPVASPSFDRSRPTASGSIGGPVTSTDATAGDSIPWMDIVLVLAGLTGMALIGGGMWLARRDGGWP